MLKICVCGGRNFNDKELLFSKLDKILFLVKEFKIINGDANGADKLSTEWAKSRNVEYELFSADWKKYKNAAGPIRNKQMIDNHIDVLIAFPGGNGTANMIKQCEERNIKVVKIIPSNPSKVHGRDC